MTPHHPRGRAGAIATAAAAGALAGAATTVAISAYALRRLVTPERDRPDTIEVHSVDLGATPPSVELSADIDTVVPGRYGLWLGGGRGHARLGDVLAFDPAAGRVTREVLGVDAGTLRPGRARWNGYYYGGDPRSSLGLDFASVSIPGPVGQLPAWHVPPAASYDEPASPQGARWAVLVHGRGALRSECLRALPVLHRSGWHCLVVGYRNDEDAPSSGDRRYALGLAEWADVDAALGWALEQGAGSFALMGWSMGGAIVLQTLSRSSYASMVTHAVLDAPVVDWNDVLAHHIRLGRMPRVVSAVAPQVLRSRAAARLVGVTSPLDVAETDWAARAAELRHRVLLIHSLDDEFVPVGPSLALAAARPDLVRLERWEVARHTKEWNTDPQRWEAVVADFLGG